MKLLAFVACMIASSGTLAHGTVGDDETSTPRKIVFPDTAGHHTLVVDLHTHSAFSDGHVWPQIRVGEAHRDGLDAYAVTEHLEWQPHLADIPHPDRNRSFEQASSAAGGSSLLVIAGAEITRDPPTGHINAVFIEDANKLFEVREPPADASDTRAYYRAAGLWPAQSAVEAANKQGAFVFWNHPDWTSQQPSGIAVIPEFHRANAASKHLHGIEIANGDTYSAEAFQIALDHKLTVIGVSDVHDLIDWDYQPHLGGHRPVTLVFATERSIAGIRDGLFSQRTVVWYKNMLLGRAEHLAPLLNASLKVTGAAYRGDTAILRVTFTNQSDATFNLKNATPLTFLNSGDLVEVPAHSKTSLDVKPGSRRDELVLTFTVMNALTAPAVPATVTFSLDNLLPHATPPPQ